MPKSIQAKAKEKIHDMYLAPTREQGLVAYKDQGLRHPLATLTMVFKLVYETRKTWKKIKGYRLIPKVLEREPLWMENCRMRNSRRHR